MGYAPRRNACSCSAMDLLCGGCASWRDAKPELLFAAIYLQLHRWRGGDAARPVRPTLGGNYLTRVRIVNMSRFGTLSLSRMNSAADWCSCAVHSQLKESIFYRRYFFKKCPNNLYMRRGILGQEYNNLRYGKKKTVTFWNYKMQKIKPTHNLENEKYKSRPRTKSVFD